MDNTYRRDSMKNQRNLFHSSPPNIEKTAYLQGYDKDTFVFIGIKGQEVRKHHLSFGISTLPPRYRYG